MQREEAEGIVISCDFCRRDWDGQEAMIEGHLGSILCLECLKLALAGQGTDDQKFKCTLCLRFNIPGVLPHWQGAKGADGSAAVVCQECLYQAARAFSRNPDVAFTFEPAKYLPVVKPEIPPQTE